MTWQGQFAIHISKNYSRVTSLCMSNKHFFGLHQSMGQHLGSIAIMYANVLKFWQSP